MAGDGDGLAFAGGSVLLDEEFDVVVVNVVCVTLMRIMTVRTIVIAANRKCECMQCTIVHCSSLCSGDVLGCQRLADDKSACAAEIRKHGTHDGSMQVLSAAGGVRRIS